jgi:hypothetical protein
MQAGEWVVACAAEAGESASPTSLGIIVRTDIAA